jgi:HAD superfamily phosphoserine phosphatase-like hydrolase
MEKIVLFDVDQTILSQDSFQYLIKKILRKEPWRIFLFPLGLCLGWQFPYSNFRTWMKSAVLWSLTFFKSNAQKALAEIVQEIPWYQDSVQTLLRYQKENVRVLLVSASIDFWLMDLFQPFKVELIASLAQKKAKGWVLKGQNCWGKEKVFRLREKLSSHFEVEACFSDSFADRPMMSLAKTPYWINQNENPSKDLRVLYWKDTWTYENVLIHLKKFYSK